VVAFLVFLGAPWDCTRAVLMAKICRWPICKIKSTDITEECIKAWATDAVKKEPGICNMAGNPESQRTIRANRWLLEWRTANWVNAQNIKGIPVPSSLLRDHYKSLWGWGHIRWPSHNTLTDLKAKGSLVRIGCGGSETDGVMFTKECQQKHP
jgi:hypothetical protein